MSECAVSIKGLIKRYGSITAIKEIDCLRVVDCEPRADGGSLRRKLGVQLQSSSLPDNIRVDEAPLYLLSIDI
ncbi:MAG: hypothetical protein F8N38_20935 [Hungatella sp.]|nr:hypothetical protein [Hungatella sp.]